MDYASGLSKSVDPFSINGSVRQVSSALCTLPADERAWAFGALIGKNRGSDQMGLISWALRTGVQPS